MTGGRSPSARIAGPGPAPTGGRRTTEQRAALWTGGVLLLACVLTVDLATRAVSGTRGGLVVNLLPLGYLAAGWLLFLYGLLKLRGARLEGSRARGPWLPIGFAFALLLAPLAGSITVPVDERLVRFTCECGSVVEARGTQNAWGHWLTQRKAVTGVSPRGLNSQASSCAHAAPW